MKCSLGSEVTFQGTVRHSQNKVKTAHASRYNMGSLVYLAHIVGHLSAALSHGKWLTRRAAYTQCDVTSVRPVHAVCGLQS